MKVINAPMKRKTHEKYMRFLQPVLSQQHISMTPIKEKKLKAMRKPYIPIMPILPNLLPMLRRDRKLERLLSIVLTLLMRLSMVVFMGVI